MRRNTPRLARPLNDLGKQSLHTPKIHEKKKEYRAWVKEHAQAGKINRADGMFVQRSSLPDTSMRRDYNPPEAS